MSTFIQLFEKMLRDCNVTMHQVAARLEIEYHVLNRFKNGNGKRSAKLLKSILNVVPCELETERELYEALFKEELEKKYGDNVYECVKMIKSLLSIQFMSRDEFAESIEMVKNSSTEYNPSGVLFCKRSAVHDEVLLILNQARVSGSHQPVILWGKGTDTLLSDIAFAFHNTEITMEHLYPLMPATSQGSDLNNLKLMEQIMPCFRSAFDYNVRIIYEDLLAKKTFFLYECLLLTDKAALWIEKDYKHAQLVTDPQVLAFYRTRFEGQYKNSEAVMQRSANTLEWENQLQKTGAQGDFYCSLGWQPCVLEFIPANVLEQHIKEDKKEYLEQKFCVWENRMKAVKEKRRTEYITLEGVKYFVNTGKILELPDEWYEPFSIKERRMVLESLLDVIKREYQAECRTKNSNVQERETENRNARCEVENENLTIQILNEKDFNLSRGIAIQTFNEENTYMYCFEHGGRMIKFLLCEPRIKRWIFCLMEFLPESGWLYPLEDQVDLLEEMLKNIQGLKKKYIFDVQMKTCKKRLPLKDKKD